MSHIRQIKQLQNGSQLGLAQASRARPRPRKDGGLKVLRAPQRTRAILTAQYGHEIHRDIHFSVPMLPYTCAGKNQHGDVGMYHLSFRCVYAFLTFKFVTKVDDAVLVTALDHA